MSCFTSCCYGCPGSWGAPGSHCLGPIEPCPSFQHPAARPRQSQTSQQLSARQLSQTVCRAGRHSCWPASAESSPQPPPTAGCPPHFSLNFPTVHSQPSHSRDATPDRGLAGRGHRERLLARVSDTPRGAAGNRTRRRARAHFRRPLRRTCEARSWGGGAGDAMVGAGGAGRRGARGCRGRGG